MGFGTLRRSGSTKKDKKVKKDKKDVKEHRKTASLSRSSLLKRTSSIKIRQCAKAQCLQPCEGSTNYCASHTDVGVSYSLKVFVMEGRGLLARVETAASVAITYKEHGVETVVPEHRGKMMSSVYSPATASPDWGEHFVFEQLPLDDKACVLEICVWEWKEGSERRFMGKVVIPSHKLKATLMEFDGAEEWEAEMKGRVNPPVNGVVSQWYPLQRRQNEEGEWEPPLKQEAKEDEQDDDEVPDSLGHLLLILAPVYCMQMYLNTAQLQPELNTDAIPAAVPVLNSESLMSMDRAREKVELTGTALAAMEKVKQHAAELMYTEDEKNKRKGKAKNACQELIDTEGRFRESLHIIYECYVLPLRIKANILSLDKAMQSNLVTNVETLMGFHDQLGEELAKVEQGVSLAAVVVKFTDYVFNHLYSEYLNGYSAMLVAMSSLREDKKMKEFFQDVSVRLKEHGSLDLFSYLIQPVQRVPRLLLLLKEIKKYTPTTDADYDLYNEAVLKIKDVATTINESKRRMENMGKLMSIQTRIQGDFDDLVKPHRHFIKEGSVVMVAMKGMMGSIKRSERILFLFSDILLWTNSHHKFKGWLNLSALRLSTESVLGGQLAIELTTHKLNLVIVCPDAKARQQWIADLVESKTRILENRKMQRMTRRTVKRRSLSAKTKTQDLHTIMQQGLEALSQGADPEEVAAQAEAAARAAEAGQAQKSPKSSKKSPYKIRQVTNRRTLRSKLKGTPEK